MRRRKYYGKPPPSKKQVQAHYDFYAQVDKVVQQEGVKMELNKDEKRYLHRLISADWHTKVQNIEHALCYGVEVVLQDEITAAILLSKIENIKVIPNPLTIEEAMAEKDAES